MGQQKRAIADAVEWMRLFGVNKPLFFVVTSPGVGTAELHDAKIKTFTKNLRSTYEVKDYVWVREVTGNGYPHYHFVADMPYIRDPVRLSLYWSGLFDREAKNSVRLGTKPDENGKRHFFVDSLGAARYVSKYIGKDIRPDDEKGKRRNYRTFAISERARMMSQPIVYEANYQFHEYEAVNYSDGEVTQKIQVRRCVGRTFENEAGEYIDANAYEWQRIEPHSVFFGKLKT